MIDEKQIIDQLSSYKRLKARKKQLEGTTVGPGVRLSSMSEDDQLQELHRQLRKLPSYLYLDEQEQRIEKAAHANLKKYPLGTRAQLNEVIKSRAAASPEDEKLLRELEQKIEKVLESRSGSNGFEGYMGVIDKISELQDIDKELQSIDQALEALEGYEPDYARLLKLRFIEGKPTEFVASELGIVDRTFRRWKQKALAEVVRFLSV
ncbi:ECF-type sigma factor [Paenibacillus sinopodophylli]|uniref:ECF-type sigma factor n=1 Tax=Paenibacillus sinopodophylli TaxID=1837342 RepID=UPI001FE30FBE|nr:ECF-type sigma factor [Paenibacillus sinopodophylli]